MVKIIADSTCDLSDATLKKYDIDMLPLYIHMGENEYKDRLEVTVEDIFKWSDQYNTTPKTSAPSIEDAAECHYSIYGKECRYYYVCHFRRYVNNC